MSSPLSPLTFHPIFKEKPWGGRKMERLVGKSLPEGAKIGESWELSDFGEDVSIVASGPLQGMSLRELMHQWPEALLGPDMNSCPRFPIMIKFVDAHETLSLQVHPGDEYAKLHEGEPWGKNEMWYVMDAEPGSELILGFKKPMSREELMRAMDEDDFIHLFHQLKVKRDDAIFVPAGCVHALKKGLFVCEIHQTSDLTYRLYDWGRKDEKGMARPLHLKKALECLDYSLCNQGLLEGICKDEGAEVRTLLLSCPSFAVERVDLREPCHEENHLGRFQVLIQVAGGAWLEAEGHEGLKLRKGQVVLIPASIKRYSLRPLTEGSSLLKVYIP